MPKFQNYFAGHQRGGDPRSPVFAAGGCICPTHPPFKWHMGSSDATGVWNVLNVFGLLFELTSPQPAHDLCVWTCTTPYFPIVQMTVTKTTRPNGAGYNLNIDGTAFGTGPPTFTVHQSMIVQKCNIDQAVGSFAWSHTWFGVTGGTCVLRQVEYDKQGPPQYP